MQINLIYNVKIKLIYFSSNVDLWFTTCIGSLIRYGFWGFFFLISKDWDSYSWLSNWPNCRLWLNIIDYFLCRFHEELISAGILTPLRSEIEGNRSRDPSVSHHVAPQGVSSIVKHFLNQSGTGVIYYPQKTFTI